MARPRQAQRHARPPPRQVRQVRAAGATRIPAPRSWSRPQSPSWTGEATAACREYWPDHGSTELQCRLSCQRGIIDRYIRSSTARRRVAGTCTRSSCSPRNGEDNRAKSRYHHDSGAPAAVGEPFPGSPLLQVKWCSRPRGAPTLSDTISDVDKLVNILVSVSAIRVLRVSTRKSFPNVSSPFHIYEKVLYSRCDRDVIS